MHSSIELNENEELINKYNQVVEEKFKDYLFYKRYTHICYPEDWASQKLIIKKPFIIV